jgi:hypothetical protein
MGGDISAPEGDGCQHPNTYFVHNTVLSTEPAAQNSVLGSNFALKTPYRGACPNESYSRDTTTINLSQDVNEYYIRFYQKWTGSMSRTVQHKFMKFKSLDGDNNHQAGHFSFSSTDYWLNYMRNTDGHFNKDGHVMAEWGWIYGDKNNHDWYDGQTASWDDYSGSDIDQAFELDRWYCIEIHAKMNTNADTHDGVMEAWVDGVKVFGVENYRFYTTTAEKYGIGMFELQHVYYNRSTKDQSTYMDNIIISDGYNGPIVGFTPPRPLAPSNLRIALTNH